MYRYEIFIIKREHTALGMETALNSFIESLGTYLRNRKISYQEFSAHIQMSIVSLKMVIGESRA